ncbi:InlB B-repeat-containing protein [Cerasicoccus fimbriatus]|uniref:InlB B-repeat-containing protein n=1 Tax=Cerasicoccus fimbriatus TaxID=3014554 RepID=UPI0022B448B2|nr:InlB B-repeat-containing protein [Cerasicoccus sp. TK19100]
MEDFSDGIDYEKWRHYADINVGRIQIVDGRLRMDSYHTTDSLNESVLTVDLSKVISAELSFQQANTEDVENELPITFSGKYKGDGVSISIDGSTWYTIISGAELKVTSLTSYTIDLTAKREEIRNTYDPNFDFGTNLQIKFQQFESYGTPDKDRDWDNIRIDAILEDPILTIAIDDILEGHGINPATISIDITPRDDLDVILSADPLLNLPAMVTIPAGQKSVEFSVSVEDDNVAQGAREVTISATTVEHSTDTKVITIHDDESPYSVVFDLDDKSVLADGELTQQVIGLGSAIEPKLLPQADWHFNGWDKDFDVVTSDMTITAEYLAKHNVTFDLGDYGTLAAGDLTQKIPEGGTAIAPALSLTGEKLFAGWGQDYSNITNNLSITANYVEPTMATISETKVPGSKRYIATSGYSVSISGNTSIVGAIRDDNTVDVVGGSVYVYVRNVVDWVEEARLNASDTEKGDKFGYSIDISGDTAIIGAPGHDSTGCAYIFVRNNGVWTEQAKITPSDQLEWQTGFGDCVGISGNTAVIGSLLNASVYVRDSQGKWTEQAVLNSSGSASSSFGRAVGINDDTIIVGAPSGKGIAYVFVRKDNIWTQQAELIQSDRAESNGNPVVSSFGYSVSISGDTAVISAPWKDSGSAYIYVRNADTWTEQAKLEPSDGMLDDRFGQSVSISGDIVVVGSYQDGNDSGSAYMFIRNNDIWSEKTKLMASDAAKNDNFGQSVSICGDTTIIGSPNDDDYAISSGSAYIYDLVVQPLFVTFNLSNKAIRTGGGEINQQVQYGADAYVPVFTTNPGWVFDGWDADFERLTFDKIINGLFSYQSIDSDSDNIMDGWEIVHLGSTSVSDGTTDSDGDGVLDYSEYVAGSNPLDPRSYFMVDDEYISNTNGQISLRVKTSRDISNRKYRVLYSHDMKKDSWIELTETNISPRSQDYIDVSFTPPGNGTEYFIRIEAYLE